MSQINGSQFIYIKVGQTCTVQVSKLVAGKYSDGGQLLQQVKVTLFGDEIYHHQGLTGRGF